MIQVVFGIALTLAFLLLIKFCKAHDLKLNWWRWSLVLIVFGLFLFSFEVILAFVKEGVMQGVLVMGSMCLAAAIFAAVLLFRFVLKTKK